MSSTNRPLLGQDARNLPISDDEVVRRVRAGETGLFEVVMRRYNQRLYRVARAILRDDAEAEDVTQQAYVNAYRHLDQFAGRAMAKEAEFGTAGERGLTPHVPRSWSARSKTWPGLRIGRGAGRRSGTPAASRPQPPHRPGESLGRPDRGVDCTGA